MYSICTKISGNSTAKCWWGFQFSHEGVSVEGKHSQPSRYPVYINSHTATEPPSSQNRAVTTVKARPRCHFLPNHQKAPRNQSLKKNQIKINNRCLVLLWCLITGLGVGENNAPWKLREKIHQSQANTAGLEYS